MKKNYRIAELLVEMDTYGRTAVQSEPYRCEAGNTDISLDQKENKENIRRKYPTVEDDLCEYMATCGAFYKQLLRYRGFMLHSSAVVVDGNAYLFTADSGTGKSTHAGLWLKMFGDRSFILNDDKPAVRCIQGTWYAFGTPWSGKNDISVNTGVPIKGIAILERGEKNEITAFTGLDAIMKIMRQCNRPRDPQSRILLMELLDKLLTEVPVWKLHCNMDPEAAIVAYEAMSGEKWRK